MKTAKNQRNNKKNLEKNPNNISLESKVSKLYSKQKESSVWISKI